MGSTVAAPSLANDFNATYTSANVPNNASPYDPKLFTDLKEELDLAELPYLASFSPALISVVLCAQGRGDTVGSWIHDLTENEDKATAWAILKAVREAITVTYPFIGLPNCVPACFGVIGVMRDLGFEPDGERRRADIQHPLTLEQGLDTRRQIYRGVGNPEVHWMLKNYFPDMTYATDTFVFGYLATGSLDIFTLRQTELIIAAAIISMGATRQSRSHIMASMQLGNSKKVVKAVLAAVSMIKTWNSQTPPTELDVDALERQLQENLVEANRVEAASLE
ncbi:hypothetical protein EDD36DRAFT_498796 [Exophiala viscosa]|uniref:Carboxymuconolactone decarboxylase-like domain-containing protein n=1 Tax=Exophiala viscosa TaxID=2486360 RepID=A0AAN6DQ65_9EURO|nr:hypothetical protein EDD36DRAFT_498796 [Exophiala viscosa]